jgi:hypothetical protein
MAEQSIADYAPRAMRDGTSDEVARLLKLVRRLEHENAALRRELATRSRAA